MVQWLGLGTFTAGAQVQSLVRELRYRKLRGSAKKEKNRKKENASTIGAYRELKQRDMRVTG